MDTMFSVLLLAAMCQIIWSTGKIEVKFSRYINHGGSGINGHCCDGRGIFCFSHCDHRFIICLDKATGNRNLNKCFYGKKSSKDIPNQNTINFGRSVGGIPNPMVFYFKSWPGKAALKVDVYDVDDNTDDKVDFLYGQFKAKSSPRKMGSKEKGHRLSTPRTLLDYKVRVYCDADYYGGQCEVYCVPQNDSMGHYSCDKATGQKICHKGWFGENCEMNDKNECEEEPSPCDDGWTCTDTKSGYTCSCPDSYFGQFCNETKISPCNGTYCLHSGTCFVSPVHGITCNCTAEWTGEFCETPISDVDPCFINPCQSEGFCTNLGNGSYSCECPKTTQGYHCENTSVCHTSENPCRNGGECVRLNGTNGWYRCWCEHGYSGIHCENNIESTTQAMTTRISSVFVPEDQKAILFIRGQMSQSDIDNMTSSLSHMIKELLGLQGYVDVAIETNLLEVDAGNKVTEIRVTAMEDGKLINVTQVQTLFLDPAYDIQIYLHLPLYVETHSNQTALKTTTSTTKLQNMVSIETANTSIVTSTQAPSPTDSSRAKIFLRGKIDNSNEDIKQSFARMIKELLDIKGNDIVVQLKTEMFKTSHGDLLTELEVSAEVDGKPIDTKRLQQLFLHSTADIQSYLPLPIFRGEHNHPHPHIKEKYQLHEIHETSWIHKHWYVALVGAIGVVVILIIITGIIIHRRRKSLSDEEKSTAAVPTSSAPNVTEVSPQSFENTLYFEMNNHQNNSLNPEYSNMKS